MLLLLLKVIIYIILTYFVFNVLYIFIYAVAGLKPTKKLKQPASFFRRKFAVFIPSGFAVRAFG